MFYGWIMLAALSGLYFFAGPALLANYFSNKNYASLIAICGLVVTSVSSLGPIIADYTFDSTGAYTSVFVAFALAGLIPVIMLFVTRRPVPGVAEGVPSLEVRV